MMINIICIISNTFYHDARNQMEMLNLHLNLSKFHYALLKLNSRHNNKNIKRKLSL